MPKAKSAQKTILKTKIKSPYTKIIQEEINKPAVEVEHSILDFWDKNDLLNKTIQNRPEDKAYTFYDGPITANNKPHYGHALTMVLKDVFPRYWTMRGYRVDRSLGWDCQGIPVEYEVEKTLGFEKKEDIESFGVEKFNKLCRESIEKYQKDILDLTKRMGRWVNDKEEFATMNPQFIESVWWSLKELYGKGLLYEGYKVVPYSTRAGTPLSNSEVALGGYKATIDPSVTIKFKLAGEDKYVLAWTTTPWTLPGNLLLAVGETFDYAEVKFNKEIYIVAVSRIEEIFGDQKENSYEILRKFKGVELIGKKYEPLFNYFLDREKQGAFKIVHGDHVGLEEGSGIVHQAPYGEEDFFLMTKLGIEMFDYLDETGKFTKLTPDFEGLFYKKANGKIIEKLQQEGKLFDHDDYEHKMPYCWRTDTPLIYKPIRSWYVAVTKISDKIIKENKKVNWIPKHIRDGRFGKWLEGARDWALSRNRYWGTPLPVWKCDKTGTIEFIGSFKELEEKSGVKITDPHKPFVDEITWKNDQTGGTMRRIPDVIDVWYDSGSMPFARFHYPFENKEKFEKKFPAKFIAEGIDQTRGWFYTLHVLGVALFGSRVYENVVVNGHILAEDGAKMSKSKKNYTAPELVLEKFGADVVRMFFLLSPVSRGQNVCFSEKFLNEVNAAVILPLWNSVKYFLTYAEIHNWTPDAEVKAGAVKSSNIMDKWVQARLLALVTSMREHMDAYHLQKAAKELASFIDDLSRWYIRRSRDRFVAGSKEALSTLYTVLVEVAKLTAPLTPFLSERIYQSLVIPVSTDSAESVHLLDYPETSEYDEKILLEMQKLRDVTAIGQAIRVGAGLKIRQPLSEMLIEKEKFSEDFTEILKEELNVNEITYTDKIKADKKLVIDGNNSIKIALNTEISPELEREGLYRELVRQLQNARKNAGLKMGQEVQTAIMTSDEALMAIIKQRNGELCKDISASNVELVENSLKGAVEVSVNDAKIAVSFI